VTGKIQSDTLVRDAVVADAAAVAAIGRVAFPEWAKAVVDVSVIDAIVAQTYSLAALRDCITRCARNDNAFFLVAERDGGVVGYLHFDCEGPEPELHRIYVDPRQKRGGIGSALLRELHARLAPGSSYVLLVHAENLSAIAFYQHHGFVEHARVDGPTYFREHMGLEFPTDAPDVPSLVLRFTKSG
jgi:ribosomal protein S18 acetylase RimI-like enzyme